METSAHLMRLYACLGVIISAGEHGAKAIEPHLRRPPAEIVNSCYRFGSLGIELLVSSDMDRRG
jgi:hypothetical protein